MFWFHFILLVVGGGLAMSSLIIAKKPEAQNIINKLLPYQAGIGVTMIVAGVLNVLRGNFFDAFDIMGVAPLLAITLLLTIGCEVIVGFLLGFGQIAKWIPGESPAEQKAAEMQQKLVKFQVPLGGLSLATAVLMALFQFNILKPF